MRSNGEPATNRNLGYRISELDRGVDETRVGLVVLDVIGGDAHAVADEFDGVGEVGAEEVGKVVLLGPLLTEEVLRAKRSGPVDCG